MSVDITIPYWLVAIVIIAIIVFLVYKANREQSDAAFKKRLNGYDDELRNLQTDAKKPDEKLVAQGGWYCKKCHRTNASYVGTCACGLTKTEALDAAFVSENVKTV